MGCVRTYVLQLCVLVSAVIRLFSTTSGKEMGDNHPFKHSHEIVDVALSQKGSLSERQLAFIDKNNDLYLAPMKPAHSGWRIVHLGVWRCTCIIGDGFLLTYL